MNYAGVVIIIIGIYMLLASFFEWKWLFNQRKAKRLVRLTSYKSARVIYGVIGLLSIVIGGLLIFTS